MILGEYVETRGLVQMVRKLSDGNCSEAACGCAATVSLDQQALCLNHFLHRCYAKLEAVDPRGEKFRENPVDLASMRAFIEECSRKALDVSLQSEGLTNLERGRLLDILLWAGELFLLLRESRFVLTEPVAASNGSLGASRTAAPRF